MHRKRESYGIGKDPKEEEANEAGSSDSNMLMSSASRSSEEEGAKEDRTIRRASKRATQENEQETPFADGSKGEVEWTVDNLELQKTMVG